MSVQESRNTLNISTNNLLSVYLYKNLILNKRSTLANNFSGFRVKGGKSGEKFWLFTRVLDFNIAFFFVEASNFKQKGASST